MTESSGADQQITNQLSTLVPSFDPSKDDMQTYQQKVEIDWSLAEVSNHGADDQTDTEHIRLCVLHLATSSC